MTDKTLEAVARAIENALESSPTSTQIYQATERGIPIPVSALDSIAQAAITAARPLIMGEAAGIADVAWIPSYVVIGADGSWSPGSPYDRGQEHAAKRIATAIRAAGAGA